MKNRLFISFIAMSVSICLLAFLFGCNNATSGGGGESHTVGILIVPTAYFGNDQNNRIYYHAIPFLLNIAGTIELGCYKPYHIAASPDGKKIYVSCAASPEIVVIDTGTNTITGLITLDVLSRSSAMRVSGDGNILYMGSSDSNDLYKVYLSTGTWESRYFGGSVGAIALKPDGSRIYFCGNGQYIFFGSTTYPFNTTEVIDLGPSNTCYDMAVKDGKVYAPVWSSSFGKCLIINMTGESYSLITGEGDEYFGVVGVPGSDEVYVSRHISQGRVLIIDTLTPTFEAEDISDGTNLVYPDYMAADGRYVCVMDPLPSSHQNVGNINTQTRSVEAYIAMPGSTIGVNNIVIVNRVW